MDLGILVPEFGQREIERKYANLKKERKKLKSSYIITYMSQCRNDFCKYKKRKPAKITFHKSKKAG